MKLKRKLVYLGLICSLTLSTNIYNTLANDNKINENAKEINYNIMPYATSWQYSNFELTGTSSSFNTTITLSKTDKYGKAFFTNRTGATVKMYVTDQNPISIGKGQSKGMTWTNTTKKDKKYEVEVRCSDEKLKGTFSLAKSDNSFN